MQYHYRKPIYDPWEIFHPTHSFIKEVIKQLKQQAYETLPTRHPLRNEAGFDWLLLPELQRRHEILCKRIRDYEWRLRTHGKNTESGNSITESQILQAKQSPIQDYYSGKLRRSGKTLVGLCPFHEEKHGSFTIYCDNNRFTCFGCGEKGDVIDFVGRINGLQFLEAVKLILKI